MRRTKLSRRDLIATGTALVAANRLLLANAETANTPDDPMKAAEAISQLEVIEHMPALYTFYSLMHPDAQAIVPRHVVIRYFREVFQAREPRPAIATGVTYQDWTWGVNGVTYPHTAVVSYRQKFADQTVSDVVRLVEDNGVWKWFFGRDRAWVDEQIRRFSQTMQVPEGGTVPYNLNTVSMSESMFDHLPGTVAFHNQDATLHQVDAGQIEQPTWARSSTAFRYVSEKDRYPIGFAQVFSIKQDTTEADAIRQAVELHQAAPPFTLHGWNLLPDNAVPWAQFDMFGSEAVGMAKTIYWGIRDSGHVAVISSVDDQILETMAKSLI